MTFQVKRSELAQLEQYGRALIDQARAGESGRTLTFREFLRTMRVYEQLRKRDPGGNIVL